MECYSLKQHCHSIGFQLTGQGLGKSICKSCVWFVTHFIFIIICFRRVSHNLDWPQSHYVAKITLNSWSSCLHFLSSEFTSIPHFHGFIHLIKDLYKEFPIPNSRTQTIWKKWAKDLTRHFTTENVCMADKHMKRRSKSSAIKMQNKTPREYWYSPVRIDG